MILYFKVRKIIVEGEPLAYKWIRMRWEKATRYYEVHLHPDLWGSGF